MTGTVSIMPLQLPPVPKRLTPRPLKPVELRFQPGNCESPSGITSEFQIVCVSLVFVAKKNGHGKNSFQVKAIDASLDHQWGGHGCGALFGHAFLVNQSTLSKVRWTSIISQNVFYPTPPKPILSLGCFGWRGRISARNIYAKQLETVCSPATPPLHLPF